MLFPALRTVASVAGLMSLFGAVQAAPTVVYREVFPNDFITATTGGPQGLEATAQGWYAAQHGGTPFTTQNGQISKPGSGNGEPGAVNSNPQGPTVDTGFFFYSPSQRAGIYLYTNEVASLNLSTSDLLSVQWDSRNSSDNSDLRTYMRLVFLVGGQWYVAGTGEPHSSGSGGTATWETNTVSLAGLTYQLFNDHNNGEAATTLPRNNDNLPGLQALPTGSVQAVGLWMNYNAAVSGTNPTIRIDNFQITANVEPAQVPEPGMLALVGLALAGLGGVRRLRQRP